MNLYDIDSDDPVDGTEMTKNLAAFLRDVTHRDPNENDLRISPEGLAGLSTLFDMMSKCLGDIAKQLRGEDNKIAP